jgi:hypothetical protein
MMRKEKLTYPDGVTVSPAELANVSAVRISN